MIGRDLGVSALLMLGLVTTTVLGQDVSAQPKKALVLQHEDLLTSIQRVRPGAVLSCEPLSVTYRRRIKGVWTNVQCDITFVRVGEHVRAKAVRLLFDKKDQPGQLSQADISVSRLVNTHTDATSVVIEKDGKPVYLQELILPGDTAGPTQTRPALPTVTTSPTRRSVP